MEDIKPQADPMQDLENNLEHQDQNQIEQSHKEDEQEYEIENIEKRYEQKLGQKKAIQQLVKQVVQKLPPEKQQMYKEEKQKFLQPEQIFDLTKDYILPVWSSKPIHNYYLEIVRNGAMLEEKKIDEKEFYLVGKNPDISDIVLENPTISRKHAVIQHQKDGEIFIYDLGSSHGTFVNQKKLPPKVFHKLSTFDTIKFAQSVRVYILRCKELEEKNSVDYQKPLTAEAQQDKLQKDLKKQYINLVQNDPYYKQLNKHSKFFGGPDMKEESASGVSWGMVDEGEIYRQQQENDLALEPDLLRRLPGLTEKQLEKIIKYEEKLTKYRAIEQDLSSLIKKESKNFGLSDKDRDKKEDIQSKISNIQSTLEQAEDGIRMSIFGESMEDRDKERKERKKRLLEYDEGSYSDDEYFDRTKKKNKLEKTSINLEEKKKLMAKTTENYWELKDRLELKLTERHQYNLDLINLATNYTTSIHDGEDELDQYMKQNEKMVYNENREITVAKIKQANLDIEEISTMLQYIQPEQSVANKIMEFDEELTKKEGEDNGKVGDKKSQNSFKQPQAKQKDKISQTLSKLKSMSFMQTNDDNNEDEQADDQYLLQQAGLEIQRQIAREKEWGINQKELLKDEVTIQKSDQKVFDITQNKKKQKRKI